MLILKIRKNFLFLIFFYIIAISSKVCALSFPSIPRPEQFVQADFSRSTDRGIEGATSFFSSEYFATWRQAEAAAGFEFSCDVFDFSTAFEVFPDLWRFDLDHPWDIRLGFGVLQHCQWQFDLAFETDLYLNTDFQIVSEKGFLFAGQIGFGMKITDLYAISSFRGVLFDRSLAMTVRIEKKWKSGWDAYFRAGTHDFYRFPIFPHPNYIFGVGHRLQNGVLAGLRFGGELQFRMNDQFTTPPMVEGIVFRAVVNYAF